MALAEKPVPLAPVPEPLALPKDIPELPDDVLKRFPTFKDWYDELTGQWWRKVRTQFYESQDTITSSTNDQVNKTNADVKIIVESTTGGFYAALLLEQIARTSADGALASSISTVIASYTAADAVLTASVVTEQTARVTADSALATSITTVTTNYLAADAVIAASVTTEATARSSADGALASSISTVIANYTSADATLQANINTANASITAEATARASADSAEATSRTTADATLTTNLGTTNANVTSEIAARVSGDSALAGSITTVIANYTAADATISASVTTEATARAAADGALYAQWGVKLDISGHVVGYIHLDGTSASSTFTVAVDKFVVTNANGTITAFDIRTGGKIVMGADVTSDNYVVGTTGWSIERNTGNVEFNNGNFRGAINTSTILATALRTDCAMFNNIVDVTKTSPAVSYIVFDVASGGAISLSGLTVNPTETQYTDTSLIFGGWQIGAAGKLTTRITQGTLRVLLFINGNSSTSGTGQVVFGPAYRKRNNGGAWGAWTGGSHDNYLTANQQNIQYTVSYDLTFAALDEYQFGIRLSKTGTVGGSIGGCVISAVAFNI